MKDLERDIELIDLFLLKRLSDNQVSEMKAKLESDQAFNELYTEQALLLQGIQRAQLQSEINQARHSYQLSKLLKTLGIVAGIGAIFLAIFLFPKVEKETINPLETQPMVVAEDTIVEQNVKPKSAKDTIPSYNIQFANSVLDSTKIENIENFPLPTNLEKAAQVFTINTDTINEIVGVEGTQLMIPAMAFVDEITGERVTGKVNIMLREYYKISDILLAKLTTTSESNLLETAGMIHLEAFQNGRELKLDDAKKIGLNFSGLNEAADYRLFEGSWEDEDLIDWRLQGNDTTSENLEEIIEVPYAVVEQVPIYPDCNKGSRTEIAKCTTEAINEHFRSNFNLNVPRFEGITGRQAVAIIFKIGLNGEINQFASNASNPRVADEIERVGMMLPKFSPGMQRGKKVLVPYSVPFIYQISQDTMGVSFGGVNKPVEMDTLFIKVRGEAERIREALHRPDLEITQQLIDNWEKYEEKNLIRFYGLPNDRMVMIRERLLEENPVLFKIIEKDSVTRGGHIVRKVWDSTLIPTTTTIMKLKAVPMAFAGNRAMKMEQFEEELDKGQNEDIDSFNLSKYAFSSSSLGWINCDRFINGKIKRIPYAINTSEWEVGDYRVSMVFKKYKSVLPSWENGESLVFGSVIADEEVVLVGFKMKNGQAMLAMINTTTNKSKDVVFKFENVTSEELKKKLSELDE